MEFLIKLIVTDLSPYFPGRCLGFLQDHRSAKPLPICGRFRLSINSYTSFLQCQSSRSFPISSYYSFYLLNNFNFIASFYKSPLNFILFFTGNFYFINGITPLFYVWHPHFFTWFGRATILVFGHSIFIRCVIFIIFSTYFVILLF